MILQLYAIWQTKYVRVRTTSRRYIRYFIQKKTHRGGLTTDYLSHCTPSAGELSKNASKEVSKAFYYFPNRLSAFASATFRRASIASNAGSAGAATASTTCWCTSGVISSPVAAEIT